ncbi:MAG: DUF1987 domain-containing protein [Bacteroidia bacterium]|jgi:hypothetical protein|nr:DUF1987 domain-containing protein [Bacteroidia bacterium]
MQKALKLKGSKESPEVMFDKEAKVFTISGRSLPEDSFQFYQPVIEWMREYVKDPLPVTELKTHFEYFNSSSIKQLLILFKTIESLMDTGKEVKIVWKYDEEDDLMEIKGKEFKRMLKIPFELEEVSA